MEILNLVPNTEEWEKAREESFNASEAPAMMNASKYMSRNELLALKKTGKKKPVDDFTQSLYDSGHKAEAMARPILELIELEDFPAIVGRVEIDCLVLQASLDGYGDFTLTPWEHKLWNEALAENVRNGILEPHYYWQLEHQLLVADTDRCIFTVSDGTRDNKEQMIYNSAPERREELIAGWKQFSIDLEVYEVKAVAELVVAKESSLPVVNYSVSGSQITSNISLYLTDIKELSTRELSRELETDQDFADKDNFNKAVKKAREELKSIVAEIRTGFDSFSKLDDAAKEADVVLQKMQSHGEKQVKEAKEAKKAKIINAAVEKLNKDFDYCNEKISPLNIQAIINVSSDFYGVIKNKRTIESIENAVDSELARCKIEIDKAMDSIQPNLQHLRFEAEDYKFLFSDTVQIINQPSESFQAIVKSRIADHKEAEEKRLEAEREKIRIEEEKKAQDKADAEAESDRIRIRAEERIKAEAEAKEKSDEDSKKKDLEEPKKTANKVKVKKQSEPAKPAVQTGKTPERQIQIHLQYPVSMNEAITDALEALGFIQHDLNRFAHKGDK